MCTAALVCHCLLPRSSEWQLAMVSLDIAATGSCAFSALYACLSDELGDSLRKAWRGGPAGAGPGAGSGAAGPKASPSGSAAAAGGSAAGVAEVAVAAGAGAAAALGAGFRTTPPAEPAPPLVQSQPPASVAVVDRRAAARAKRRHIVNLVTGNGLINISAFWGVRVPFMAEAIYIGTSVVAAVGVSAYVLRRGLVGRQWLWFGLMLLGAAVALAGIPLDAHLCLWLGPHANHVVLLFAGCDLIMYGLAQYVQEDLAVRYDQPYYERRRAAAAAEKAAEKASAAAEQKAEKAAVQGKGQDGAASVVGGQARRRGR
ncbi:hypothetical protein HYH02_003764 [Chlamydomonas schloesseri]|uniref:Uncharacterized protein n=1 Tax=Chlamydomonas schloesseri TaxID=2026947 RepID=A0A835WQ31_9CHLO|nr:hypothetical protein HYH02_003764 [Chlamydomonas schloesseri]|eukprot:KAG2451993.1 hypothetical protein HYH02_003764 [Chlamydomonas schloesseri]